MLSKINEIAYEIANLLLNPIDGVEIGGLSHALLRIIRIYTSGNSKLKVLGEDWLNYYDCGVLKKIELLEEYDRVFG